jgi:hypothetical protein
MSVFFNKVGVHLSLVDGSLPSSARSRFSNDLPYRNSDVRGSLKALITTLSGR